jgi:hypothetical protein
VLFVRDLNGAELVERDATLQAAYGAHGAVLAGIQVEVVAVAVRAHALLALVLGTILILNPFESTKVLWTFAGIALIVSAIPDVLVPFIKSKKNATDGNGSGDTTDGQTSDSEKSDESNNTTETAE